MVRLGALPSRGHFRHRTGKWSFYVSRGGSIVNVIVATSRFGHKYLKTEADGEQPNNLLSAP